MRTIIGVDPGSRITGYGVIQTDGQRHRYLASGCLVIAGASLAEKLQQIFSRLTLIIQQYEPSEAAVEQVFVHRNAGSALKLGQARGAALVALAQHGIPIAEYSPRSIKQAVVGYGAAEKAQVQKMIKLLLNHSKPLAADAADALAVAICHAHSRGLTDIKARLTKRERFVLN